MSGKYADGSRMIIFWWGVRPTVRPVSFCFLLGVMPLANLPLPMGSPTVGELPLLALQMYTAGKRSSIRWA